MMMTTLQGSLPSHDLAAASAWTLAPIAGFEATVAVSPGTCGSSVSSLGPIGKRVVATLRPALVASSTAVAMPTELFGAMISASNLPEVKTSSTCEYCLVALNSPSKISTEMPPICVGAFLDPLIDRLVEAVLARCGEKGDAVVLGDRRSGDQRDHGARRQDHGKTCEFPRHDALLLGFSLWTAVPSNLHTACRQDA